VANFDHLWHTFNDYYAFFDERGIDWNKQYAAIRPSVTDELTDDELIEVFRKLLSPLNDGHIQLITDNDRFEFADKSGIEKYVRESFADQTRFDDIEEYGDSLGDQMGNIISSYFVSETLRSAGGSSGERVRWALNSNNVGYLYISGMEGIASGDSNEPDENVKAINSILKDAMADLNNTDALIVDVRFNGGGFDEVSLAIASHFTDQSVLAFSKVTRSFAGETNPIEAFFTPATDQPYLNPVVILTSEITASAAEVFLTAMSALPKVTLVGEKTAGILADQLERILPNNWIVAVPNVVFMNDKGISYEVTGVSPDVEVKTNLPELLDKKKDPVIETALSTLGY